VVPISGVIRLRVSLEYVARKAGVPPSKAAALMDVVSEVMREELRKSLESPLLRSYPSPGDIARSLANRMSDRGYSAEDIKSAQALLKVLISASERFSPPPQPVLTAGMCESCRHMHCDTYDPSPGGVALGPGSITDCGCDIEDEVYEKLESLGRPDDVSEVGRFVPCPLWEPRLPEYCERHGTWYDPEEGCLMCFREAIRETSSKSGKGV